MNLEQLALKHERDYTGCVLADYYEAAFPLYEVYLRVALRVRQALPTVDQHILRAVRAEINTAQDIADMLGIEHNLIYGALGQLQQLGLVDILAAQGNRMTGEGVKLTPKGYQVLENLVMLQTMESNFNICMDAITGEYYRHQRLWNKEFVRENDMFQIKACIDAPRLYELDMISLRRIWRESLPFLPDEERNKELVEILDVDKVFVGYRPMRVLQFIHKSTNDLQLQVYDGSNPSESHAIGLLRMERNGVRVLRAEVRRGPDHLQDPVLQVVGSDVYEAAQRKVTELPRLEEELRKLKDEVEDTATRERILISQSTKADAEIKKQELEAQIEQLEKRKLEIDDAAPNIRILSMAEHRPWLLKTLRENAREQVIIISPWLTPTAVDRELRDAIEGALQRGVDIWIGYGFDQDPDYRENQVLRSLEQIARGKNGRHLRLVRLKDSHAKVVICDQDYMITTSFNWLSFAGRRDWGNRVEFGTLTSDPQAVKAMLELVLPLFES